jgi:hypothetical protein
MFFIARTKPGRVWVFCFPLGPVDPASLKPEPGIRLFSIICQQNCYIFRSRLLNGLVASGTHRFGHNTDPEAQVKEFSFSDDKIMQL